MLANGKNSLRSIDNITVIKDFENANPKTSFDDIKNAFDSLKANRKKSFIDALKRCSNNKSLTDSLSKSRLASVNEIKDALNKMRDFKAGKPQSGNLGYLQGNISGATINDNKPWTSVDIQTAEAEIHIFEAVEATGNSGTWKRITDSEYRMLNDLAYRLGGEKGKVKQDVTGSLKVVSENPYCESCKGVIQQFSNMFPNIEITLIDGVK